jgi:hypothetical protein
LDTGRNALRDANEEHVSFHLEKKWETTKSVRENNSFLEIESTNEFNRNHEVGSSLMTKFGNREPFNTPTCLEHSCLSRSREMEFIEYPPFEEKLVEYQLDNSHHMYDEASFEDKILKHLEDIIVEVIIGTHHHKMMVMLGSQYIISPHKRNVFLEEIHFLNTFKAIQVCMIMMRHDLYP